MRPRRSPAAAPRLLLLALLLPTGLFSAGCQSGKPKEMTREQKLELYTETASYLYEDGSFLRAQDQAVKALELDPENQAMRRMVGWIRLRMGTTRDLTIAEDFFRRLVKEGDEHPASIQGLACACERLGLGYEQASRAFASGERQPEKGQSGEEAAARSHQKALDYWKESKELYTKTLDDREGSTRSKNGLQRVCAYLGDYEESLSWSKQVLDEARQELAQWRRMLTASNLSDRDEDLMRTNEAAAVQLLLETHLFAANLLHDLGRDQEALSHIDEAVQLDPSKPDVYALRGQLREATGDPKGAIADIDEFLKSSNAPLEHPDIRKAFDLRAKCEEELGKAKPAADTTAAAGG